MRDIFKRAGNILGGETEFMFSGWLILRTLLIGYELEALTLFLFPLHAAWVFHSDLISILTKPMFCSTKLELIWTLLSMFESAQSSIHASPVFLNCIDSSLTHSFKYLNPYKASPLSSDFQHTMLEFWTFVHLTKMYLLFIFTIWKLCPDLNTFANQFLTPRSGSLGMGGSTKWSMP